MSTQTGPAPDTQPRGPAFVPGPKGLPLVGNLPQFGKNPLAFFELLRGHGDMVRWRFGRNRCVFIADPDLVGELLTETERTFDQPKLGIAFRTVLGNGMLVARGRDWRRKRSLVQPSVRPKQVKSYATTMADCAVELADRWADGQRVDVKREMSALTQKIAVRTIFGVDTPRTPRRWGGRWTSPRWRSARSSPGSARCCRTGCRHRAGRGSGRPPPSSTPRCAGSSPGTGAARRNAPICSAGCSPPSTRAGHTSATRRSGTRRSRCTSAVMRRRVRRWCGRGICSPATPASATRSPRSWTGCSATGSPDSRTTHNCRTPRPW